MFLSASNFNFSQLGYIVLLVGESGSGKTTVANFFENNCGMQQVKSYTTRPKRFPKEDNHTFVSESEFSKLRNLIAYTKFDGYEYCATAQQVDDSDLYVIDPAGVHYFYSKYTGDKIPFVVYLSVPEEVRTERMLKRGDSMDSVQQRIQNDDESFKSAHKIAHLVVDGTKPVSDIVKAIWTGVQNDMSKDIGD